MEQLLTEPQANLRTGRERGEITSMWLIHWEWTTHP